MVPGSLQSPQPCKESTSLSYSRSSSLEGTVLVPSFARNAVRLSQQPPRTHRLIQWKSGRSQWDLLPQLAVWPIYGKSLDVQTFQTKLSTHHGEAKHLAHMILTSRSGWASVLNRVMIPFQDPFQM